MRASTRTSRTGRRAVAALVAVLTAMGLVSTAVGTGGAEAATRYTMWINACGMPTNGAFGNKPMTPGMVKVNYWHRSGNTRTVVMLDGMRAQYDRSGWEINTNVSRMANSGVNVVMPVGGPASFYTNWDAPSNFNGQKKRYMWDCVINQKLISKLRFGDRGRHFATKGGKFAIMGISSGGNAALVSAAHNRSKYYAAASLSGYNFLSAPGMRTALRLAMLDVAPQPWNVDSMWGPPWSPRWTQNDPFMNINRMHGLKLYIGSGNGLFGKHNNPANVIDDLFKGTPLELLAFTQAKAFETGAIAQGLHPMTFYANGTHAWGYWQDMVWNAKARGFFR